MVCSYGYMHWGVSQWFLKGDYFVNISDDDMIMMTITFYIISVRRIAYVQRTQSMPLSSRCHNPEPV
jgi:hypothetical protein